MKTRAATKESQAKAEVEEQQKKRVENATKFMALLTYGFLAIHTVISLIILPIEWTSDCTTTINPCLIFMMVTSICWLSLKLYEIKNKITTETAKDYEVYDFCNYYIKYLFMFASYVWALVISFGYKQCQNGIYKMIIAYPTTLGILFLSYLLLIMYIHLNPPRTVPPSDQESHV